MMCLGNSKLLFHMQHMNVLLLDLVSGIDILFEWDQVDAFVRQPDGSLFSWRERFCCFHHLIYGIVGYSLISFFSFLFFFPCVLVSYQAILHSVMEPPLLSS